MKNDTRARWRRFFTCRVLWVSVACIVLYAILAAFMPRQPFLEFVRILQAVTGIVVVIAFSADAWESLVSEESDKTDGLVIGAFLQHITICTTGIWLLLYRLADRPTWMLDVLFFAFFSGWLSSIASILHVIAPGVLRKADTEAEVPPARLRAVGFAAAAGATVALIVLAAQPNVVWLVESLRPWIW